MVTALRVKSLQRADRLPQAVQKGSCVESGLGDPTYSSNRKQPEK